MSDLYDSLDKLEKVVREKKKRIEEKDFDYTRDVYDFTHTVEQVLDSIEEEERRIYGDKFGID